MRTTLLAGLLALVTQAPASPAGHWEGSIHMGNRDAPIVVDLAKNAAGAWIGSLSVTGTTAMDVPVSDIVIQGDQLKFSAGLLEAPVFDAKLAADAISGSAANAQGAVPFELKRTGEAKVNLPRPSSPLSKVFEGSWTTTIAASGTPREITLKLSAAADGTAKAVLLQSGQSPVPFATVLIKDSDLELESRAVSGTFKGRLGADGQLTGEWSQGQTHVPMVCVR